MASCRRPAEESRSSSAGKSGTARSVSRRAIRSDLFRSADESKPELSRSLRSRTESDAFPSSNVSPCLGQAVEIFVPPRNESDQGLSSLRCGAPKGRPATPKPGRRDPPAAPRRSAGSDGAPRSACPAGASCTRCWRRRRGRYGPPSRPSTRSPAARAVPSAGRARREVEDDDAAAARREELVGSAWRSARDTNAVASSETARTARPRRTSRVRRCLRRSSTAADVGRRGPWQQVECAHAGPPAPVTSVTRRAKPATSSPVAGPGAQRERPRIAARPVPTGVRQLRASRSSAAAVG